MGMSASQARLLSLTSRLHDVELKAQNLQSHKIALATQKDELYQDYCDALDATRIKVAYRDDAMKLSYIDANYTSLCTYNECRRKNYMLRDNKTGYMLVSEKVQEAYETYGNDKYAFAYAAMGYYGSDMQNAGNDNNNLMGSDIGIGKAHKSWEQAGYKYANDETNSLYMTAIEAKVYEEYTNSKRNGASITELEAKYEALKASETKDLETQKEALDSFRKTLYENCGENIFKQMSDKSIGNGNNLNTDWETFNSEFKYYLQIWEAINAAGGCQVIDPQYESGDVGNEWLNNVVNAGIVSILVWDDNGSDSNCWAETSAATSYNENYLQELQDETNIKKAEAKYEHELGLINDKDKKYDLELSKLETERSAITTEMDSINKVKEDNIERTFGLFS